MVFDNLIVECLPHLYRWAWVSTTKKEKALDWGYIVERYLRKHIEEDLRDKGKEQKAPPMYYGERFKAYSVGAMLWGRVKRQLDIIQATWKRYHITGSYCLYIKRHFLICPKGKASALLLSLRVGKASALLVRLVVL